MEHLEMSGHRATPNPSTEIGTIFLDRDLQIVRLTPSAHEFLKALSSDCSASAENLTRELPYTKLQADIEQVLEDLKPLERQIQTAHDQVYVAHIRPSFSMDDELEGVVLTFFDITTPKRAQRERHESGDFAEDIVDTVREGLLVLDSDLRVQSASASFYETFEVDPEETRGCLLYDLGNGQWDIPELRELLEEVLPDNKVFNGYKVTHSFESIGKRTMILNGRRLDHVQKILLAIQDITGREQAEKKLRKSEERYRRLVEQTAVGIASADLQGHVTLVNEAICELLGYTEDELLGKNFFELTHSDHRNRNHELFERLRRKGEPFTIEKCYYRENGSDIWLDVYVAPVYDEAGRPQSAVAIMTDISERKKMEEELKALNEELEARVARRTRQLEEANEKLRRQMAERERLEQEILKVSEEERWRIGESLHEEAGQTLTGIHMLMSEHIRQLENKGFDEVSDIEHIRDLIKEVDDQLLGLARGIIPLQLGDSGNLRRSLTQLVRNMKERHGIECEAHIDRNISFDSDERATHVYRIVQEAMQNAVLHKEASEVVVELRVDETGYWLAVSDNGSGREENIDQASPTGIGLQFVQYRCRLLQGTLTVDEAKIGGMRVVCTFPAERA